MQCRCNETSVTGEDIRKGLKTLGLGKGDGVMVHSSLKSFGYVHGGAGTVIKALQETVTDEGTLLMPTFNHGDPFKTGGEGFFDVLKTPTRNGAVPELFRKMPGVVRSLNPTHAFCARGRHAERYIKGHHKTLTMGADSPLGLLFRDGGLCLLIGVGFEANTFHHVVETMNGAPCLGYRTESYPVRLPGERMVEGRTWSFRAGKCPLTPLYPGDMERKGLIRRTLVGKSKLTLFRLSDCCDVYSEYLRKGGGEYPPCADCGIERGCTGNRQNIVESDFGSAKQIGGQ